MKQSINLPTEQKAIVATALKLFQSAIESMIQLNGENADDDHLRYQHFDCHGLIGIFTDDEVDVAVELDDSVMETFVHRGHAVDFPEYV